MLRPFEITSVDKNGNVNATVTLSDINREQFLSHNDNKLNKISIYYACTKAKAAALADYARIVPNGSTINVLQTAYDGYSFVDISTEENNAFKTDPTAPTSFSKQLSFQLPAEAKGKNIAFLVVLDGNDSDNGWNKSGSGSSVIFNYTWEDSGFTVTYVANNGNEETRVYKSAAGETHTVQGQLFPAPDGMEFALGSATTAMCIVPARRSPKAAPSPPFGRPPRAAPLRTSPTEEWEYHGGNTVDIAYRSSFAPMQGGRAMLVLNNGETAELMNIYPGTTVWVNPIPDPGYRVASIVWSFIDGSASFDITETKCFVMPAMEVVIFVTFQPVA